jgi:acyl carrier protein
MRMKKSTRSTEKTRQMMMPEQDILEQLKPLLVQVLGVSPEMIRPESVLVKDLGAESIDLLDLSFRIEERFKVNNLSHKA